MTRGRIRKQFWHKTLLILVSLVLFIGLVIEVFPLLYMANNSLKTDPEIVNQPFHPATSLQFINFKEVWRGERTGQPFSIYFRNSFIVTACTLALLIFVSSLAGYALGRESFPGKTAVSQVFILLVAVPAHVLMVPIYFMMESISLRNNLFGLILLYATLGIPFSTMLMRGYFASFPKEIEEAAIVDGCTRMGSFLRIVLPMSTNAIATVAICNVSWIYSELFFALVLMTRMEMRTVPLAVAAYRGVAMSSEVILSQQYTAITLASLPLIVVYFFFQRKILKGMTMGAFR